MSRILLNRSGGNGWQILGPAYTYTTLLMKGICRSHGSTPCRCRAVVEIESLCLASLSAVCASLCTQTHPCHFQMRMPTTAVTVHTTRKRTYTACINQHTVEKVRQRYLGLLWRTFMWFEPCLTASRIQTCAAVSKVVYTGR